VKRLWPIIVLTMVGCALNGTINPPSPKDIVTLQDASVSLAVDVSKGGAITYLNILDGPQFSGDVIDHGDATGRELQVSFRDGPQKDCWPCNNQACASGYNPTQEGSACQVKSGGVLLQNSATNVTVDSMPLNWDQKQSAKIALRSSVTLQSPGVVRLDWQATNNETFVVGSSSWGELPVAYLRPDFVTGTLSNGQTSATSLIGFRDDHGWIALSRADGWTVALYATGDHLSSIGIGTGGAKPTSYLQLWQWLELRPAEVGAATAWLVVGRTLEQTRTRLETIR